MDEPGRDLRPGDVGDQPAAPLDGHVLENDQVDGQGAQVRADGHRRVRHPRRALRHVLAAAAARTQVQVMLDPPRGRAGDLQLLERAGHSQVLHSGQVRAALACPLRVMITGLIGFGPAHRRSRRAGLLAAVAFRRAFGCPPLLTRRRLAARGIIPRGWHRGIPAVTGHGALQPGQPRPQLRYLRIQDSEPRIAGRAAIASRGGRGQNGHKP